MFELATEIPLIWNKHAPYYGIAYHEGQTYLSSGDKQIYTLNESGVPTNQVLTFRKYHTLCYDSALMCFWGASFDNPDMLFRLSSTLDNSEPVSLMGQAPESIHIDHLFYDNYGEQLYLTQEHQVYAVDSSGNLKKILNLSADLGKPEGVCAYNQYLLCISSNQEKRTLSIYAISNGTLLERQVLPDCFDISAMTLVADPSNPLSLILRLLIFKQDEGPFLLDYRPNLSFFSQYSSIYQANKMAAFHPSDV